MCEDTDRVGIDDVIKALDKLQDYARKRVNGCDREKRPTFARSADMLYSALTEVLDVAHEVAGRVTDHKEFERLSDRVSKFEELELTSYGGKHIIARVLLDVRNSSFGGKLPDVSPELVGYLPACHAFLDGIEYEKAARARTVTKL